jgi:hypothetical protein
VCQVTTPPTAAAAPPAEDGRVQRRRVVAFCKTPRSVQRVR